MTTQPSRGVGDALRGFLAVPFDAQTYRNLAYLLLAFPLGIGYFVGLSAGLSTGLGLAVTLVGLPVLVLTVAGAAGAAGFEAKLASWLLGVDATPPAALADLDRSLDSVDDLLAATRRLLTTPTTWTSVLLLVLKFAFGIVAFTALVTASAVLTAMLAAPLLYDVPGITYNVGAAVVDSLPEALAVAGAGVFAALVSLHLLNALATLGGVTTAFLLGDETPSASASADSADGA
jgi:hypothetical protein